MVLLNGQTRKNWTRILNLSAVDRLGKLPLQERQLSRTQHFNLLSKLTSSHVRSFHTHNRLMRNTADPYDTTELSPINTASLQAFFVPNSRFTFFRLHPI